MIRKNHSDIDKVDIYYDPVERDWKDGQILLESVGSKLTVMLPGWIGSEDPGAAVEVVIGFFGEP